MGMSAFYKDNDHQASEQENIQVIHQAITSGVTMLDTSDMYGPFTNEELVGTPLSYNVQWHCMRFDVHPRCINL